MSTALVASFQLFAVGFTLGLSGPCMLACGPALVLFFSGRQEGGRPTLASLGIFMVGKTLACSVLGALAGVGASALTGVTSQALGDYIHAATALLLMLMGLLVYFDRWITGRCAAVGGARRLGRSSLFLLGFALGASPCPPLIAVLSEITLISRSPLQGLAYGTAFGLGNAVAGVLAIGSAAGLLTWLPAKLLGGSAARLVVYRKVCGVSLVLLGFWLF